MTTLAAFNGHPTFSTAYSFSRDQIHAFLTNVANNPAQYRERDPAHPTQPYPDPNSQATENRARDLRLLRGNIIDLTPPRGEKYRAPPPPQSTLRRTANSLNPTDNIPWSVTDKKEKFFIIYDLLGTFLSIISPAPTRGTAPTAKNFFLPLVVVFAKWCSTLAGGGSSLIPSVAQITWARKNDHEPWSFFVGASAKGWAEPPPPNPLIRFAKDARRQYMFPLLEQKYHQQGRSPVIEARGPPPRGFNFGNCGETYPFLYLIDAGMPPNRTFGIAIDIAFTFTNGTNWSEYPTKPPCQNCSYVLDRYHVPKNNFLRHP